MKKRAKRAAIGPESLDRACYQYLSGRNYVLWGHNFNIQSERSRREAAEWLSSQVQNVLAIRAAINKSGDAPNAGPPTSPGST